jgi:FkbM family methyltransferase
MLKAAIKLLLHKIFGLERFLYWFSLFKIRTLRSDKNEKNIFVFISELKGDGIVLDIGANIGIMTGVLANTTNRYIHAFEPLPLNYTILEKIIRKLKIQNRVTVHKIALGNYSGFCEMVLPIVHNVKMHGLSHVIDPSITEFNTGQKATQIPIDKLDNIVNDEKIAGMKIDVENFEFEVLKGAHSILTSQKPVLYIELWDNENRRNCFSYLRELDYTSYAVQHDQLIPFEGNISDSQTFVFK